MNSRGRQLAVIRHEIPDRISVDAICIENQEKIAQFLNIDIADVLKRLGIDGRIVSAPFIGELPKPVNGIGYTEWGTANTGDYSDSRANPLANATSIPEIDRYAWPDSTQYDFEKAAKVAEKLATEYAVRGPYWKPIFCRACDLFGMEESMIKMVSMPDVYEAVIEHVFVRVAEFCRNLLAACGDAMPILCIGDDFATQRGLMIPPEYCCHMGRT